MSEIEDHDEIDIKGIGNYYGCLSVKVEGGVPYWSIENWDGHHWDEIPDNLYLELIKHNESP